MKNELKHIEEALLKEGEVNLGKQCKNEYIIYHFYGITEDNMVKNMKKEYYNDSSCKVAKKSTDTVINKFIKEVVYTEIYELLLNGYELVM